MWLVTTWVRHSCGTSTKDRTGSAATWARLCPLVSPLHAHCPLPGGQHGRKRGDRKPAGLPARPRSGRGPAGQGRLAGGDRPHAFTPTGCDHFHKRFRGHRGHHWRVARRPWLPQWPQCLLALDLVTRPIGDHGRSGQNSSGVQGLACHRLRWGQRNQHSRVRTHQHWAPNHPDPGAATLCNSFIFSICQSPPMSLVTVSAQWSQRVPHREPTHPLPSPGAALVDPPLTADWDCRLSVKEDSGEPSPDPCTSRPPPSAEHGRRSGYGSGVPPNECHVLFHVPARTRLSPPRAASSSVWPPVTLSPAL